MTGSDDGIDFSDLRPVVLGSGGRVGRAVSRELARACPETVAATRVELDICDYFGMRWELERLEANLVINAAGWADVDGCEKKPESAFQLNALGAADAARAARAAGAHFVHISTDFVFDGRKGEPYVEDDELAPLSAYGKSKAAGERLVMEVAPDALVVRTSWIYGGTGNRPDFVRAILARAETDEEIDVVSDQVGTPTHVVDLARDLLLLIGFDARGIVHVAGGGEASRADLARAILAGSGLEPRRIKDVLSAEVSMAAPRPADSRLDTSLFTSLTGTVPRSWQEALPEALTALRSADVED